jgi:Raf kinase inhibitor-like YbhB/YbcL family protein
LNAHDASSIEAIQVCAGFDRRRYLRVRNPGHGHDSCQRRCTYDPDFCRPRLAEVIMLETLMALALTSTAFGPNGPIPKRHTCQGQDVSAPLAWSGLPAGTRSLALIVDDPDAPDPAAPKRTWVHWVLYNIPPETTGLAEAVEPAKLPPGTLQGRNDWGRTGYGGPCPPIGRHRYFHKLYALDTMLPDLGQPSKIELEKAMHGHVLAKVELVGTYQKE